MSETKNPTPEERALRMQGHDLSMCGPQCERERKIFAAEIRAAVKAEREWVVSPELKRIVDRLNDSTLAVDCSLCREGWRLNKNGDHPHPMGMRACAKTVRNDVFALIDVLEAR